MLNFINTICGVPLGYIMWGCYALLRNYGVALIVFTLLTKLLLFPLNVKQQKGMTKMARLQPKIQELQKKYANNREKLQEEQMKLFEKENYNPMSGCLPMLIQFPLLFGIIDVVYKPLSHILRFSGDVISQATTIAQGLSGATFSYSTAQIGIINAVQANPSAFSELGSDFINKVQAFDLHFLGIDLGAVPWNQLWSILLIVPILSGLTSFLVSLVSMKTSVNISGNSGKVMFYIMPLFSLYFTFIVPAGVGIYWIFSNLFAAIQSWILNRIYNPKEIVAKMEEEEKEARERERLERIAARKAAKDGDEQAKQKALSKKEINKQRLALARKLDAEKYGEEYEEISDSELNEK